MYLQSESNFNLHGCRANKSLFYPKTTLKLQLASEHMGKELTFWNIVWSQ